MRERNYIIHKASIQVRPMAKCDDCGKRQAGDRILVFDSLVDPYDIERAVERASKAWYMPVGWRNSYDEGLQCPDCKA
jgi:hypothetical protein